MMGRKVEAAGAVTAIAGVVGMAAAQPWGVFTLAAGVLIFIVGRFL